MRVGDLERLRPGWFATSNRDETAAAAVRDGGALTCVDALRFHEFWTPPGHGDRLHLRRSTNTTGKNPPCRPRHGRVRTVHDAVDSPIVALHYATGCLDRDEWIAVADSYMNSTSTPPDDLAEAMGEVGPVVRQWLAWTDPRSQSGTESIARVRFRSAGYDVVVQPPVEGVGHVDLRIGLLLIECDSRRYHATEESYRNDRRRDRRAVVDGWLVLRLTYDDILYDWAGVLADVAAVCRRDRHRARTAAKKEMLRRSVRQAMAEGNLPPNPLTGTDLDAGAG